MLNRTRTALLATGVALASAGSAFAQVAPATPPVYTDQVQSIVNDGVGIIGVLVTLVIAVAGFGLFRRLAHKA